MEQKRLIEKFNKQAKSYEKKRQKKTQEKWRKKLFSTVRGKTLEVAVGAGANFPFYPNSIDLTAVDFSPKMLEKAKQAADEYQMSTEFILSDVESLTFPDDNFDTIISTLSLCGYEDPVHVLNLFNKWCEKDGQILLMEHGISSFGPLAWIQNQLDPLAFKWVGCHQNRDISKIVKDSRIEMAHHKTHLLGYVHLIKAQPQKP